MAVPPSSQTTRQVLKAELDRWVAHQGNTNTLPPAPPGQRNKWNALALKPLRDKVEDHQVDAIIEALGFVLGAEAVTTLLDALHLSPQAAKERQLTTAMWILRGGLADITASHRPKTNKKPRRPQTT